MVQNLRKTRYLVLKQRTPGSFGKKSHSFPAKS